MFLHLFLTTTVKGVLTQPVLEMRLRVVAMAQGFRASPRLTKLTRVSSLPSLKSVLFPGYMRSFTRILSPAMGLWVVYDTRSSVCPYEILNGKKVGSVLYIKYSSHCPQSWRGHWGKSWWERTSHCSGNRLQVTMDWRLMLWIQVMMLSGWEGRAMTTRLCPDICAYSHRAKSWSPGFIYLWFYFADHKCRIFFW